MTQNLTLETQVQHNSITLHNLPLKDNTTVKVIIIPQTNLKRLSFQQARILLQDIEGELSDDIQQERTEE